MSTCPACGGGIGRDCWNPQECAVITAQMQFEPPPSDHDGERSAGWREAAARIIRDAIDAGSMSATNSVKDDIALAKADAIAALPQAPDPSGPQGGEGGDSNADLSPASRSPGQSFDGGCVFDPKDWEVSIRLEGENILTIGHGHLAGLSDIERYADVVRLCADHLRAFIGSGEDVPCFACDGSGWERWVGLGGAEEVAPCSVCASPPENSADDGALAPHTAGEGGQNPSSTDQGEG